MLKSKSIIRRRVMEVIERQIESAEAEYAERLERIHDDYDAARRNLESQLETDKEQVLDGIVSRITSKII